MNKAIKRAAILFAIFAAAVITYFIWNRESLRQINAAYDVMEEPVLPTVSVRMYDREMNNMHGYRQDMGNKTARENLTILPEDRALPIHISAFAGAVRGLSYEIRSLDLERLVEHTRLEDWNAGEDGTAAVLPIQNLLARDREYLLRIDVETETYGMVYYYTRIMWTENQTIASMIDLAVDFSARTFDYNQARELVTYLESNSMEDNGSFGRATIRSSFSQLTWGRLKMQPAGEVQVSLKEAAGIMGSVSLRYLASRQDDQGFPEYYEVEETFVMKWSSLRIYLMDYERTVNQIFTAKASAFSGERIMLGISNDDQMTVRYSPQKLIAAFLANRELWSYNQAERRAVKIFSFRGEDPGDIRSGYNQHAIEILQAEDNGNVDFLVYGYMNSGRHEGQNGVICYHYEETSNTMTERFFLPVQAAFEELQADLRQIAVCNTSDRLYLYIGQAIYAIDLTSNEYMVVADGLAEGSYAVSADKKRIAWQEGGQRYESTVLHLLDLETGEKKDIHAAAGELVRVLGFVGRDLVYGMAKEGDAWVINGRTADLPMYALEIINDQMQIDTRYEKEGSYIANVKAEESRIHLDRVHPLGNRQYAPSQSDTIVCNEEMGPGALAGIGWYASADKGKLYFVQLGTENKGIRSIKVTAPKKIISEEAGVLKPESAYQNQEIRFYAYSSGHLLGRTGSFAQALKMAYDRMGIVTDQNQNILWSRVNRSNARNIRDTLTALTPLSRHLPELTGSKSFKDGVVMLNAGGCSMMQVLYFIDQGIPVVAYTGEGSYLVLTGFDQYNVMVYDPQTKETVKTGLNDATEFLKGCGNDFVCAVLLE